MNVTQRHLISFVLFGAERGIEVHVVPQYLDEKGRVVMSGGIQLVRATEADVIALGKENGRTDGEWGNREIEQLVIDDTVVDQPAVPEIPAVEEMLDINGKVLRQAQPAVPGIAETRRERFDPSTPLVWQ